MHASFKKNRSAMIRCYFDKRTEYPCIVDWGAIKHTIRAQPCLNSYIRVTLSIALLFSSRTLKVHST
jgi:hypothetical protein